MFEILFFTFFLCLFAACILASSFLLIFTFGGPAETHQDPENETQQRQRFFDMQRQYEAHELHDIINHLSFTTENTDRCVIKLMAISDEDAPGKVSSRRYVWVYCVGVYVGIISFDMGLYLETDDNVFQVKNDPYRFEWHSYDNRRLALRYELEPGFKNALLKTRNTSGGSPSTGLIAQGLPEFKLSDGSIIPVMG